MILPLLRFAGGGSQVTRMAVGLTASPITLLGGAPGTTVAFSVNESQAYSLTYLEVDIKHVTTVSIRKMKKIKQNGALKC